MTPQVNFSKWQGLGNDYIILAAKDMPFEITPERAIAICDRHFGIGADGILAWGRSDKADFRLDIYNPDGSKAEMCGNGIRMLARCLISAGHASGPELTVDTDAGIIKPSVSENGVVRVDMGTARLGGPGIIGYKGVPGESEALNIGLEAGGSELEGTYVDMGNPHCVIEVDDIEAIEIAGIGPAIENHKIFPDRANVEFIKVENRNEVSMRVWERGVGETYACGTGACAVAVAACRTRDVESPVTVHLPGGDLIIEVDSDMKVFMTGPAEEIYSGIFSEHFIQELKEL